MERQLLIDHFQALDFVNVDEVNKYDQISIAPDLVFEKDSTLKAIVIRESADSLPVTMIQRLADSKRIPAKSLELYFAFPSKPSRDILRDCKTFAVGILYPNGQNNVEIYAESKQIKGRRVIAAIPRTQFFFSSRQHAEERREADTIITDQRDSLRVPIFSMLVENDQQYSNDIRKLWPVICRCMDDCRYVVIILSGEYRKIIDRETRRALEYYDPEEILFYIKSDKETKEQWAELITTVGAHKVKYTDYFDLRDFKLKFNQRLMKIIVTLHEENNVQFLADGV